MTPIRTTARPVAVLALVCCLLLGMGTVGGADGPTADGAFVGDADAPPAATNESATNRTANATNGTVDKSELPYAVAAADNPALSVNRSNYTVPDPSYGAVATSAATEGSAVPLVHNLTTGETRRLETNRSANATASIAPASGSVSELTAGPTPLDVKGPDDRVPVEDTTAYPYRSVTRLFSQYDTSTSSGSLCSGAMVGPYHVLTAAHCVHDSEKGYAERVRVEPGATDGSAPFGTVEATNIRTYSGWTELASPSFDIALLTLDEPIGNATGWMGMTHAGTNSDYYRERLYTAGFPASECDSFIGSCTMIRTSAEGEYATQYRHYHHIDQTGGQSGSSTWIREDGSPYTISVNAYSQPYADTNFGTRITAARFADFRSWMRNSTPPARFPNLVDDGDRWVSLSGTEIRDDDDTLRVGSDVRNIGTANVTDGAVSYYLSTDATLDDGDTLLAERSVTDLQPFAYADVSWTGTIPESVPDGDYRVIRSVTSGGSAAAAEKEKRAAVRDPDSGDSTHVYADSVSIDRNGPAIRVLDPGDGALTTLPFTVEANATDIGSAVASVSVRTDGSRHSMAATDGNWTTSLTDLPDGPHSLTVRATDGAGNTNRTTVSVIVDTTAPVLRATDPGPMSPVHHRPGETVRATLSYDERRATNLSVALGNDSVTLAERSVPDPSSGVDQTATATLGVPDGAAGGAYDLVWRLTDAGLGDTTTRRVADSVVIDAAAPTVDARLNRSLVAAGDPVTVHASTNDDIGVTRVVVNGTNLSLGEGEWRGAVSAPDTNGTATLSVRAFDAVGRTNATELNVTVDARDPVVALDAPERSANASVPLTGAVTDDHTVNATLVGPNRTAAVNLSGGTFETNRSLAEGVHELTLRAADSVGNRNATTETVTVDRSGPSLARLSPRYVATDDPTLGAALSDALGRVAPGASELTVDGRNATANITANASVVRYRATNLSDGRHRVAVRAADRLGNPASDAWNVTVDTTAPLLNGRIRNGAVAPGANVTVRANASDRTPLTLTANGTALAGSGGNWTGRLPAPAGIGTYAVRLSATDAANNTNTSELGYGVGTTTRVNLTNDTGTVRPDGPLLTEVELRANRSIEAVAGTNGTNGTNTTNASVVLRTGTAAVSPGGHDAPAEYVLGYPQLAVENTSMTANATLTVPSERLRPDALTASSARAWVRVDDAWAPVANATATAGGARLTVPDLAVGNRTVMALTAAQETTPPVIESVAPGPNVTPTGSATVRANYTDGYAGVDPSAVRLSLNGEDVTANATANASVIRYTVDAGTYNATLDVADEAGNVRTRSWTFSVAAEQSGGSGFFPSPSASSSSEPASEHVEQTTTAAPTTTEATTTSATTTAESTTVRASSTSDGPTDTTGSPGTPGFGLLAGLAVLLGALFSRR